MTREDLVRSVVLVVGRVGVAFDQVTQNVDTFVGEQVDFGAGVS